MDDYKFNNPYKYNNWYIFPETTLANLELNGCESSVDGKCHNVSSVSECVDLCNNSKTAFCDMGYFIEGKKENVCVPMARPTNISIDEYYRLRNQKIYNNPDETTYVFFNGDIYPFPPNTPNTVFYFDYFQIKNINTGMLLSSEQGNIEEKISFYKTNPINIQLLPKEIFRNKISKYLLVKNGDSVVLNIPSSALVIRKKSTNSVFEWILRASDINMEYDILTINAYNRKPNESLCYADKIYFTYLDRPVIYDEVYETLIVSDNSVENSIANNENLFFELIPQIKVFYCNGENGGKCESIQLEKTDRKGHNATYKNNPVSRSPSCWNMCKNPNIEFSEFSEKSKTKKKDYYIYFLLLIILIIVIIILINIF